MKVRTLFFGLMLLGLVSWSATASATTIGLWTFETSVPTTAGPLAPESGAGSATAFHVSTATVYSNPSGNGSLESWSSNNWAIGDYYQFNVDTTGLQNIVVSWDQTRSSTGPGTFDLEYSIDGVTFLNAVNDYTVPAISWSSATPDATLTTSFSFDFSSILAVNDEASVTFRMTAASAPSGTAGTNRVDNVLVEGVAIPEPASAGLLAMAFGALVVARRRRR